MGDDTLITFANHILATIYAATAFTDLPVTEPALTAAITAFTDAKAAQPTGGKPATALKNERRATLVAMLKELALFVQVASANNLATLLSSGFDSVSTNRSRTALSKPAVLRIVPGMTGQALGTLSTERNSRGTEMTVAEISESGVPGPFRPVVFSTSSRNIVLADLVPGKLYAVRGRNLGGSTMYSDWSDPITHRAA